MSGPPSVFFPTDGLDLRERGEMTRLIVAESQDREHLYKEIARANGVPGKADEVKEIFAEIWREKADSGW